MKKILPLLLFLLAGCATHTPKTAAFERDRTDWDDDKDFYYRSWLHQNKGADEQREDHDFYYGSWLRND